MQLQLQLHSNLQTNNAPGPLGLFTSPQPCAYRILLFTVAAAALAVAVATRLAISNPSSHIRSPFIVHLPKLSNDHTQPESRLTPFSTAFDIIITITSATERFIDHARTFFTCSYNTNLPDCIRVPASCRILLHIPRIIADPLDLFFQASVPSASVSLQRTTRSQTRLCHVFCQRQT